MHSDLDGRIWHGEKDIADLDCGKDGCEHNDKEYNLQSMFDNDFLTYSSGGTGDSKVYFPKLVAVKFKEPIEFHSLHIATPPADGFSLASYQSLCLVLDSDFDGKICTSHDNDVAVGEVIILASASKPTVTEVKLLFQAVISNPANIADFKIHYKRTLTLLYILLNPLMLKIAIYTGL